MAAQIKREFDIDIEAATEPKSDYKHSKVSVTSGAMTKVTKETTITETTIVETSGAAQADLRKIKSDLLGLKVAVKQLKQSTHEQIMSLDDSATLAYADMRTLTPKMAYLDLCPWTQPKMPRLSFNEMNSLHRT